MEQTRTTSREIRTRIAGLLIAAAFSRFEVKVTPSRVVVEVRCYSAERISEARRLVREALGTPSAVSTPVCLDRSERAVVMAYTREALA